MLKKISSLLLLMLMSVGAVLAQSTTSGITGRITDSAKEELPGVFVQAKHVPSGTVYKAVTNSNGYYTIMGMRPGGPYELKVNYMGFKPVQYEDIHLSLGETSTYNITMLDSNMTLGEVVVTADQASRFNSLRTGAATNFGSNKIENTPTISRSLFDVTKLMPQAVSTKGGLSLAGSSNKFNSFQIDGTVNNDVFGLSGTGTNGGQAGVNPISLDAIEELQVVIAPFDVRQGGFTGGGINAITKSGTNQFKGSAYGYYNNQNFIGTTAGKDVENRKKLSEQMTRTLGATFGGPIVKDKLFFFGNIESVSDSHPSSYNVGDGSNIKKEEVDAVVNKIKELTGGKYDGGGYAPMDITSKSLKLLARVDWNINDANKFTLRTSYVKGRRLNFSNGRNSLHLNDNGYYMNSSTTSVVAELHSRLSNTISNELRLGYTRVRDNREIMGEPFAAVTIDLDPIRSISFGSEKYSVKNRLDQDIYTLTDNFSMFFGAHTVTIGTHNELFNIDNLFIRENYGSYVYDKDNFLNIGTPQNHLPKQYNYSYSLVPNQPDWAPHFGAAQLGFYAQDEWAVFNRFKLTYGLRLDLPLFFDKPGENKDFNNTAIAKEYGVATNQMPQSTLLWSPRLGFRWNPDAERKILIRGGLGIFTGRVPFVWVSNSFSNTGIEMARSSLRDRDLAKPEHAGFAFNTDPYKLYVPNDRQDSEVDVMAKNFKFPQVFRVNLAFEHRLPGDIKLTLEGIYTKTLNNILYRNLAYQKDGQLDNGTKDKRITYKKLDEVKGRFYQIPYLYNTNKGYTYNLSAKLEKDFKFGLSSMLAYSYGRAYSLNDGNSSQAYSNWKYNETYNGDAEEELSPSDYDSRHRIVGSLSYRKEYAKHFATTISLFYSGQSGANYSVVYNGDMNGDGSRYNDLLYVPTNAEIDNMVFGDIRDRLTNKVVVSAVDQKQQFKDWIADSEEINKYRGTYVPKNTLTGPFEHHFDLHIAQDFYFNVSGRRNTLQLNFDILNIGNLFNRAWGLAQNVSYNYTPLSYGWNRNNRRMEYQFARPYNKTLYDMSDFASRWRAQIGVKYIF